MEKQYIFKRLNKIKKELDIINSVVTKGNKPKISLKGIIKDIDFSEREIEKVKKIFH